MVRPPPPAVRTALALWAALALGAPAASADWTAAGGPLFVGAATASGPAPDASPAPSPPVLPYAELVAAAAAAEGLDPRLLHAVVAVESGYRARAVSPAGAAGLTQLMPATAAALGVRDRFDPAENLAGGAAYLAQQLRRFGDVRLALAAYNAGPARVARLGRVPELAETRAYVAAVVDRFLALAAGRAVGGPFGRRPARPPGEPDHGPLD